MNIADVLDGIPACWDTIIKGQKSMAMLNIIIPQIKDANLAPKPSDIFNAFKYIDNLNDIAAIIIGQDPYINQNEAMGLSFSVPAGIKIPPSLVNIYSCLQKNSPVINGDLRYWASQGVVLLNAALTTVIGTSGAHMKIWEPYTDFLIAEILAAKPDIGLILWGSTFAWKKSSLATNPKTMVLKWGHPSPMANNKAEPDRKFSQCDNFGKLNNWLISLGRPPIEWSCGTIQKIVAFTDGAASANGTQNCIAGWGVYFPAAPFYTPQGRKSSFIGLQTNNYIGLQTNNIELKMTNSGVGLSGAVNACEFGPATNNRAELAGILQALIWILGNTKPPMSVLIVSDSTYSINSVIEWGPKRIASNSLHEKANPELIKLIIDTLQIVKNNGYYVDFLHMRGHGKDKNVCDAYIQGNEVVDRLAVAGAAKRNN